MEWTYIYACGWPLNYTHQETSQASALLPKKFERSWTLSRFVLYWNQGYRSRIEDIREEIRRKERAVKLRKGATTVLKAWWQSHSDRPFPTVQNPHSARHNYCNLVTYVNDFILVYREIFFHCLIIPTAMAKHVGLADFLHIVSVITKNILV